MRKRLTTTIVISLLIHLLLLLCLVVLKIPSFTGTPEAAQTVWIDLKKNKYEIADIEQPAKEEKPDETKFLGMVDSKTPSPTVAERQGREKEIHKAEAKNKNENSLFYSGKPRPQVQEETLDAALPEDYYPDFRRDQHTYLNVMRYPDVQYFVRLKKVFKTTFNPVSPLREAYFQNRITQGKVETVLGVTLDKKGNLAEIFVFRESGIPEYDEETMRNIRASSPFSAPQAKFLE